MPHTMLIAGTIVTLLAAPSLVHVVTGGTGDTGVPVPAATFGAA